MLSKNSSFKTHSDAVLRKSWSMDSNTVHRRGSSSVDETEIDTVQSLKKTLSCRTRRSSLKKFLVSSHCEEGVLFWENVRSYKVSHGFNTDNTYFIFTTIVDLFLTDSSPHELNVSSEQKLRVLSYRNLDKADNLPIDVFDEALDSVLTTLSQGPFQRYSLSRHRTKN